MDKSRQRQLAGILTEGINKSTVHIYLDLDGVFADFDGAIEKGMGKPSSEVDGDEMWEYIRKEIDNSKWFYNLPKMADADTLYNYVKDYKHTFLSASGDDPKWQIANQKKGWVKKTYGGKTIVVKHSRNKAKYATENSILIDDRKKSIEPWKAAGGIGILHKNAADTIRQLKELGL